MNVLNIKLRRDLIKSLGMLSAVVAIIAVGTGSFVGMLATFNDLEISRDSYYNLCRMADFWIDLKKAPVEAVRDLVDLPGVAELRERICFPVIVDLEDVDEPISGRVISLPAERTSVINGIYLKSGSYFSGHRRDEVIVSDKFASARGLGPGDFISLIMNGRKKKLFIVGTAISSEHIYTSPPGSIVSDPSLYGIFYIKRDYAEDMFGFHGACNSVVGLFTPRGAQEKEIVLDELNRRLSSYGVFTSYPLKDQFSNLTLSSEMSGLRTMATMLPLMFLGVAALVLNVLMTRMAEQQRMVVGTFKALGYFNRQIMNNYFKFALVVGIAGGAAGCLLGDWLSLGMVQLYKAFFEFPRLETNFYPGLMLIAVFISVFFAVAGAWRGVKKIADLNPAEAMREPPPPVGGKIWLERFERFWERLGFWWQIVLRGIFRNKRRTLMGIFASAMGTALMVMALGMSNSMDHLVEFQFSKVLLSDFNLSFKNEISSEAVAEAGRLPGVTLVEPLFEVACTFFNKNHHKKGVITGITPAAVLTVPRAADGARVPVPPSGILMTARLAEHLKVKEGETVTILPVKGIKNRHPVRVVKIIKSLFGLSVYADYGYLNRLVGERADVSSLQLRARQTRRQKKAFFRQLKKYPRLEAVSETLVEKKSIRKQMMGMMNTVAGVMIVFAGIIFFGSILNSSLISIAERHREIATFRVMGYQPMEIGGMFIRENMLINLVGVIPGLPAGWWLLQAMMTQYNNDAFTMVGVIYSSTWFWVVFLSVLFVLGAHLIVQRNINKLNWQEALSMKE